MDNQKCSALVFSSLALSVILLLNSIGMAEAQNDKPSFSNKIVKTLVLKSSPHNAEGHSSHQAAYLVHPQDGYNYRGTITFTSDSPVDILVYHDVTGMNNTDGFNLHKVDGRDYVPTTVFKNVTSGSFDFVGSGVLAHLVVGEEYVMTASIDAFARKVNN